MTPRIRKIVLRTEDQFVAYYKGCHLVITPVANRRFARPDGRFYAIVRAASGGCLHDGWLGREIDTMDAAVTEAVMHAGLTDRVRAA